MPPYIVKVKLFPHIIIHHTMKAYGGWWYGFMCSYSRCRLWDKWVKWNWINLQWNYCTIHSEKINFECYLISSRIYIHNICTEKSTHDTDRDFCWVIKQHYMVCQFNLFHIYYQNISACLPQYFSTCISQHKCTLPILMPWLPNFTKNPTGT
jgi:hypothetical protein